MSLRRAVWLAVAALGVAGCATGRSAIVPEAGVPECHDAEYRGAFTAAGRRTPETFRMSARICAGGLYLLEFRGAIGGAALQAGVRAGDRVRLVFPSKRVVVDGPDEPAFWEHWTGVPLDGALVREFVERGATGRRTAGEWTADVTPAPDGESLPALVDAADARGDRLRLRKARERAAPRVAAWPDVPPGFEHRSGIGASSAPDGGIAR